MKCSTCSAEGGSGKFCRECGAPLTQPEKPTCSSCGAELLPTAKFCAKCGKKTAMAAADISASPEPKCPKCGTSLQPGARFCKACGAQLTSTPVATVSTGPTLVEPPPQRYEPPRPSPPPVQTPVAQPVAAPAQMSRAPAAPVMPPAPKPSEAFPTEPSSSAKKPALLAGVVLAALIGSAIWWFALRTPPVNNAPIVKGPLYDQPAR